MLLVSAASFGFAQDGNLFPNGEFDSPNSAGDWPAKISKPNKGNHSWGNEGGERFIRMESTTPLETVLLYQQISLRGAQEVEMTIRARVSGLVKGPKSWFDARIMGDFRDSGSQKIKDFKPITFGRDTDGWVERTVTMPVPDGAVFMAIMPSLLQVNAGTLDIASITVTPVVETAPQL
ncbi:MAG: hypothetical protein CML13_16535 [Puniceicoccaceae bacterium]|nr:hypothetical protein [Puniceicoccaceae bacterium]